MITPIDHRQLHLVRAGAAANAPSTQIEPSAHTSAAPQAPRSKLSQNVEDLVIDAYKSGLADGEEQHYRRGWRWGAACGLLWGLLAGASIAALAILGGA